MSRQSQKTEVVNKINIRIGDLPRKRKRRKRTLKPKNQGGFQHSPSGAFRRRTPMFAPTPMRPMYDGWARENMPTFQGHVSPHKKKESTTTATQTPPASTPVLSTAQPVPVTPTNQRTSSGTSSTASPGTMAALMDTSTPDYQGFYDPNIREFTPPPQSQSTPARFPTPFSSPPIISPDPGSSPTNVSNLIAGLIPDEASPQISSPPFQPRANLFNSGTATPLRRATLTIRR